MLRTWILIAAAALAAPGCAKKVDAGQARKACEHQMELGFWQGFAKTYHGPIDDKIRAQERPEIEKMMASGAGKDKLDQCAEVYADQATQKQIDCILAATTVDGSLDCVR